MRGQSAWRTGALPHWAAAGYPDQLLGAPAAVGLAERGHAGPRGGVASGLPYGEVGRGRAAGGRRPTGDLRAARPRGLGGGGGGGR